jgi:hypothetical protein
VSLLVLLAWVVAMAALINRSYLQASTASLATDLARYGSAATWRGVYYRGEKIGFTVSQTVPTDAGFDLEESGRLQMALLGATTAATIRTTAHVDRDFAPPRVRVLPRSRHRPDRGARPDQRAASVPRRQDRERDPHRRARADRAAGAVAEHVRAAGQRRPGAWRPPSWSIFDPATLRNSPVTLDVGRRELVRGGATPIPAFKVEMAFAGLRTTSWITDTGEVLREESPLGLITVRESPENARAMAVSGRMRVDLQAAPWSPRMRAIGEPRDVRRMRMRLRRDLRLDLDGGAQRIWRNVSSCAIRRPEAGRADPSRRTAPEAFIESDAPEIIAEARKRSRRQRDRARAERLTRYVNALLDKKPTSACRRRARCCARRSATATSTRRCTSRWRARSASPARIAGRPRSTSTARSTTTRGRRSTSTRLGGLRATARLWLPVDPTLNQFPADATHLRLARGGLDKQAAILR